MTAASSSVTPKLKPPGRAWRPGESGNPRGRPKAPFDIAAMCREHAPEAVATLVACLRDPRHKVAAAEALLNRGFGRPPQNLTVDTNALPNALHLLAAQAIGAQLNAALAEPSAPLVINGEVELATPDDLLSAPRPLE